jgi:hypothetical protein
MVTNVRYWRKVDIPAADRESIWRLPPRRYGLRSSDKEPKYFREIGSLRRGSAAICVRAEGLRPNSAASRCISRRAVLATPTIGFWIRLPCSYEWQRHGYWRRSGPSAPSANNGTNNQQLEIPLQSVLISTQQAQWPRCLALRSSRLACRPTCRVASGKQPSRL